MNAVRVGAIASNVFREILRERVIYLTGLYAVGFVLAVTFLNEVAAGTEAKISLDVGVAGMGLIGLTVAAFVGGGLIHKEVEKRTALVLISKPLSKAEFVIGKHLGISAVLVTLLGIMTVIYLGVLAWRGIVAPFNSLVAAILFMALELSLMAAVALLFGVFSSALISTILTISVYVMGHFSGNLVALSESVETGSLKIFIKVLYLIFPDLSRLDLKNQAVYGLLPDPPTLLFNFGYGIIYIGLLLAIASLLFSKKEF
ncbi:ABC transporter permease [Lyngbya confervoides]|uniref:ABC transporter permease n=1 Tax=Lyngbya confervoides BDU141951 TaxID=1574623 RepID=A0ABD4T9W7_9CYAN|nr:ABC transporter permease [Lyngbya confervoides]MCM1985077.1 ABC transporter permease [Lyngbya confervoides BDU141951]